VAMKALTLPIETETPAFTYGSVLFIGTATTLIRYAGFTVLTDPNFLHAGDPAHLGYGLTSTRQTNPALEIADLPRLDLCVLSHLHGDHWDRVATETLPKALPILTTPHAAAGLRRQGFTRPQGLATWDTCTATKGETWLRVTAMPGRHGPPVVHRLLPPVMGACSSGGRRRVTRGSACTSLAIPRSTMHCRKSRSATRTFTWRSSIWVGPAF
jgi:L-ascorbate metabolism protein UlaG (beta-lactamase superfamily)